MCDNLSRYRANLWMLLVGEQERNQEDLVMKKVIITAVLASLSLVVQAGDVEAGKKAYETCANCHGAEGKTAS